MQTHIIKQIERILSQTDKEESEILFQLRNLLYEHEIREVTIKDSIPVMDLFKKQLESFHYKEVPINTLQTGFNGLDEILCGINPGEFIVFGGRPGMGKSQFLVNLALNISTRVPLLYISFDLSESLLTARFMSCLSNIPVYHILQQTISDKEHQTLFSIEKELAERKIFINDNCNNSFTILREQCLKMIKEQDVKVIIIDYIQLISQFRFRNNREMEISYISRELKNIARENNVCIIAASQLSRAVETRGGTRHPILSDLRESGALEQDADKVLFIYRPEYYRMEIDEDGNSTSGLTEMIIAKNRNGKLGTARLKVRSNFTAFYDFDNFTENFTFSENRLDEINSPPF